MAKFTKYNNPNKRKRKSIHSDAYVEMLRKQRDELLAKESTLEGKNKIMDAFDISIRPY